MVAARRRCSCRTCCGSRGRRRPRGFARRRLLGSRRTITGAAVEPRFPLVAAAQAEGVLSERHAAVITRRVDTLPDEIADQSGDWLEATLVEHGRHLDPTVLDSHARQLVYRLDQDGQFDEQRHRRQDPRHRPAPPRRRLRPPRSRPHRPNAPNCWPPNWTRSPNPNPSAEAGPDPRTARQRRHDGFEATPQTRDRAAQLPRAGGITTTVLLTMDADAWITGDGTATTGHGYTLSAATAKRWAGARHPPHPHPARQDPSRQPPTPTCTGSSPNPNGSRSSPATAAAPSSAVTPDRNGARSTTSPQWHDQPPHHRRRGRPDLLRRPPRPPSHGLATHHAPTASRTGSRRNGSTPTRDRSETRGTTGHPNTHPTGDRKRAPRRYFLPWFATASIAAAAASGSRYSPAADGRSVTGSRS